MTVQQTFYNQEPNPIEAVYVFPLDAKAAVCEFSIRIDGHLVHGGAEERVAARDTYRAAISEGHAAFLLEQPMPDVFQVSVGNLASGEQADVTIAYLKLSDGNADESDFPIPTWFSPRARQSSPAISFLAVAERPDEDKPLGRLITRKVPMAPAPGDYFYFGATIGHKFGQKGAPALEEEGVEQEEGEAVPAIMDRGLDLGGWLDAHCMARDLCPFLVGRTDSEVGRTVLAGTRCIRSQCDFATLVANRRAAMVSPIRRATRRVISAVLCSHTRSTVLTLRRHLHCWNAVREGNPSSRPQLRLWCCESCWQSINQLLCGNVAECRRSPYWR